MRKRKENPPAELDSLSIEEFCRRNCLSRGLFYKLRDAGKGPKIFHAGNRVLISKEEAAAWRSKSAT